jgi:hypothetical protein
MDETIKSSPREFSVEMSIEGRGSFSASGPDDLVFRALKEFQTAIASVPSANPEAPERRPEPITKETEEPTPTAAGDGLPLGPFYAKKKPRNNQEAIAVFTVWSKRSKNIDTFTAADINDLWRTTPRKLAGKNLGRDIGRAVTAGWLERAGKTQFKVTGFGETFVDTLPERQG